MMTQSNLTFTENHEIPEGYKKTEVGIIPNDWTVESLQNLCRSSITYGIVQCGPHIPNGIPYIRVSDMNSSELNVDEMLRTSPEIASSFGRSKVEEGDIVYALRGKLGEVKMVGTVVSGANLTQGTARIAPKNNIDNRYLLWTLRSPQALKQAVKEAKGSTFVEITLGNLKGISVPLPSSREEQQKIATALSDTDALISELEKLIEKKQAIKTATMQQLLTGKTRLPEFALRENDTLKAYKDSELGRIPEDWNIIRISEIALVQRGASPRPIDSPIWFDKNSDIGWLRISDLTKSFKYLVETSQNLSKLGVLNSRYVPKNQLVMSICATVGKPIITKKDLCIHDGFVVFNNLKSEMDYLYYVLEDLEKSWSKKGQTGSQMNLNSELINQTIIRMPPSQDEQRSIATIISDMDQELKALYRKLNKANYVRQGMMQELLTGKTRLV